VTTLQGQADITPPAGKVRALKLGDPINNGDILRTKAKAKVEITFTDGNTLWLAEKTRMKISRYSNTEGSSNVFDLFRGKSRSVVTKLARGSRVEVHTPTAVCGVRGTTQISMFLNGQSSFFLQGGAGYGYNRNNPGGEVGIPAGHGMVVTDGTAQPVVKPSTAADIEKHMEDTSAGNGEGAQGLSDAGTTLDPSAPWTPGTGEETPPPTIPQESSITFSTPVLLGDFSGTLGGSFDPVTGIGTVTFGGTGPATAAVTPMETPLTGTLSNGATFTGLLGGVPGSYSGFFNSITNNGGTLGLLAGNLDGTFADGAISATGPLTLTNLGYTAAGEFQNFPNIGVPTFTTVNLLDLSYNVPVEAGLGYGYPTSSGGLLGIWGSAGSGYYGNPGALTSWQVYYGYDWNNNGAGGPEWTYMLGLVSGTDDLAGHTTLTGNDSIQYMDQNYFGLVSVNYRGDYIGETYETAGTGTFKLAPLAFSGPWGMGEGLTPASVLYNDGGAIGTAGEDVGIVGGFALPWLGATTMYAMGGYSLEPESGSSYDHYLWNTPVMGAARTGENAWDENRSFSGRTAGLWLPGASGVGTLEGAARMLFGNLTDSGGYYSGTIGILGSNNLRGNWYTFYQGSGEGPYYEDGMWRAEGTLSPFLVEQVSNASSVSQTSAPLSGSGYYGGFRGAFNNGGLIDGYVNGEESFTDFFVVDGTYRPWGVYNMSFESAEAQWLSRPAGASTFSAYTGGQGYFGYGGSGGHWLASVKGTWNDAGEVRGWLGPIAGDADAFGVWMNDQYMGPIGGPFYAINVEAPGSWVGTSIGTYVGQPLAFRGNLGYGLGSRDGLYNLTWDWSGYGYLGYYGSTSSYLNGIYGSTTAPTLGATWTASAGVTMLGDFYYIPPFGAPQSYEGKLLWNYAAAVYDWTIRFKAGDNMGYTAGIVEPWAGKTMDGAAAMLYVDAAGKAGILTSYNPASYTNGGVTGNLYPFYPEGMSLDAYGKWLAGMNLGGIQYTQDNYFDEMDRSRFALRQGSFDNTAGYRDSNVAVLGYGGSESLYFNNPNAPGALPDGALPWGVYDLKFSGIYNGSTYGNRYYINSMTDVNDPGADLDGKTLAIGGKNGAGWFQVGSIYDTLWADNRIDGKVKGHYMSLTQWGEFGGPFYGLYADPYTNSDGYGGYYGYGGWTGESVGTYTGSPLAFVAQAQCGEGCDGRFWQLEDSDGYYLNSSGNFYGLVGGLTSLFTGAGNNPYTAVALKGMGMFENWSDYPLFLGRFEGQGGTSGGYFGLAMNLGGVMTGNNTSGYTASGSVGGAYWRQTDLPGEMYVYEVGVLYSPSPTAAGFFGVDIPPLDFYQRMWELGADAKLQAYAMGTIDTDLLPGDGFFEWTISGPNSYGPYYAWGFGEGHSLTQDADYSEAVRIADGSVFWSVGSSITGGSWSSPTGIAYFGGKTWTMTTPLPGNVGENYDRVSIPEGGVNTTTGVFNATVAGAQVNWGGYGGWTSVHGAVAKGLFNPTDTTSGTWRAMGVGVGMETGAFLAKVQGTLNGGVWEGGMDDAQRLAFQNATSIPSFAVGTINLASDQTAWNNNLKVDMGTMTFFSPSSGGAASIWGTSNVSGQWNSAPSIGTAVDLKIGGVGTTVGSFTPRQWGATTWGASVQGGPLNLGGVNTGTYFQGGAAGTVTGTSSGTFGGTGAGVVTAAPMPD
jgi:hypothetical protein